MRKLHVLAAAVAALVWVGAAQADTVVPITSRAGLADYVDWGSVGSVGTILSNPFDATSNGGIGVTVSQAGGSFKRLDQSFVGGWWGNFADGDNLLWTLGGGPLTITFATPVAAAGAQIQADIWDTFSGNLTGTAYNPLGQSLGSFNFSGISTNAGDNSAPFIGIRDLDGANIASITFNVLPTAGNFAINMLSIDAGESQQGPAVPLPASSLGGLALLGLLSAAKLRKPSPAANPA
jgi:hypothetical protein